MKKILIFLDFDDVLCLDEWDGFAVFSLYQLKNEQNTPLDEQHPVWNNVFAVEAKGHLRALHNVLTNAGHSINYVVSSSWRSYMRCADCMDMLRRTGLEFVAEGIYGHQDREWRTPKVPFPCYPPSSILQDMRKHEIQQWLDERGTAFDAVLILDDFTSGSSLHESPFDVQHQVVLCRDNHGFSREMYLKAQQCLQSQLISSRS